MTYLTLSSSFHIAFSSIGPSQFTASFHNFFWALSLCLASLQDVRMVFTTFSSASRVLRQVMWDGFYCTCFEDSNPWLVFHCIWSLRRMWAIHLHLRSLMASIIGRRRQELMKLKTCSLCCKPLVSPGLCPMQQHGFDIGVDFWVR